MRIRIFIILSMLICFGWHSLHGGISKEMPADAGNGKKVSELPELIVKSHRNKILHMLGYLREYSTLTTYTDTVYLFREKMVDFMLTGDKKGKFIGWSIPRVLSSDSYYRFTDNNGLDSVSNSYRLHFSWSDKMILPSMIELSETLRDKSNVVDSLEGRYGVSEVWRREGEKVNVEIDVLADEKERKWVPELARFFHEGLDFDRLKVKYSYDNITDSLMSPENLTSYSYHIDSYGRGVDLFRFNGKSEPYFVTTDADIYIIDREYISEREAKKWHSLEVAPDDLGIILAADAPELSASVLELIDRVTNLDSVAMRVKAIPDRRLSTQYNQKRDESAGRKALQMLKNATGISQAKRDREWKRMNEKWKKFTK